MVEALVYRITFLSIKYYNFQIFNYKIVFAHFRYFIESRKKLRFKQFCKKKSFVIDCLTDLHILWISTFFRDQDHTKGVIWRNPVYNIPIHFILYNVPIIIT